MQEAPCVFERVLEVSSSNEWIQPVDGARVRLSAAEIERLLELAEVVKKYKVETIEDWNYAAEWGFLDEGSDGDERVFIDTVDAGDRNEDGPFRSECNVVAVSGTGDFAYVCWRAYWKHTDVQVSTEHVNVQELREAIDKAKRNGSGALSNDQAELRCTE